MNKQPLRDQYAAKISSFTKMIRKNSGRYTPFYDDLLESDAYMVLSVTEKAVLVDLLRSTFRAFASQQEAVELEEFSYTYSMCAVQVSITTFYDSIKNIIRVGFITKLKKGNEYLPAISRNKYVLSEDWKNYTFSEEEKEKRKSFLETKRVLIGKNSTSPLRRENERLKSEQERMAAAYAALQRELEATKKTAS